MHTFYAPGGVLEKEDALHAKRVLRLKEGDEVTALSDGKRFRAVIGSLSDKGGTLRLSDELPSNESPLCLTIYQGLVKAEKLELLAQKLTELGADRLVPVRMEHSVAKAEGERRTERLDRIAREAVKQCRRSRAVGITAPLSWQEAVRDMAAQDLMIVPWESAEGTRMGDLKARCPDAAHIGILIGPEGGITEQEILSCGAVPVTLGPRILRAETAALTAAALAMSLWGDI